MRSDAIRKWWTGRRLPGLMKQQGLLDLMIVPDVTYHTTFALRDDLLRSVAEAKKRDVVSAEEGQSLIAELETRDREGQFFLAGVIITVARRKPSSSGPACQREPLMEALVLADAWATWFVDNTTFYLHSVGMGLLPRLALALVAVVLAFVGHSG